MPVDSELPEAPLTDEALAPRDYGDLLGESLQPPAPPETEDEPEDEQPEPLAAEQAAPQLPQTAAEWMVAIDASPGREAQVPGRLRAELRDLREQRYEQRLATELQKARTETRGEAEQRVLYQMQIAAEVAEKDAWLDEESSDYDPLKFIQWQRSNPQAAAHYAAIKAQVDAPPAAQRLQAADPLAVISEANADLITAWKARPDIHQRIVAEAAAGKYGALAPDGNWTPASLSKALRDADRWINAATPQTKPDPAAKAVEQRQAAAAERGAIPKPAGGGAPAAGGAVTPAMLRGITDPAQMLALKRRDPEGYDRAVAALSR